jgi:hypothetical protein
MTWNEYRECKYTDFIPTNGGLRRWSNLYWILKILNLWMFEKWLFWKLNYAILIHQWLETWLMLIAWSMTWEAWSSNHIWTRHSFRLNQTWAGHLHDWHRIALALGVSSAQSRGQSQTPLIVATTVATTNRNPSFWSKSLSFIHRQGPVCCWLMNLFRTIRSFPNQLTSRRSGVFVRTTSSTFGQRTI